MKRIEGTVVGGLLLILFGALLLLQNLGILGSASGLLWAILFGLGGLGFLYMFFKRRALWWAIIPGCAFLGIAWLLALGVLAPGAADTWGAPLFLGLIALGFWLVYLIQREQWWAVIPAGVLSTLTVVAALAEVIRGEAVAGILFLGLGATFALVYLLRGTEDRKWALIPAGILALFGVIFVIASTGLIALIGGAVLILAGLVVIVRGILPRRAE